MGIGSVPRRRHSPVDTQGMKRAVAGIAVIILTLAGPAVAAEQSSSTASSQAVEIGSALTVTATETITMIGLVVTITRTPAGSSEGPYPPQSFEIS